MIKNLKKIFVILSVLSISHSHCQENLESSLIGKWEFKLDIKDVIKNSDELTGFEKLAARTFSGVIEKALYKTQILFDFKEDKTAAIIVITSERTESRVVFNWRVDEKGNLIVFSTTKNKIIVKFNFYKKKYKKFKKYLIKLFIWKALPNLSYNGKS
mgnify:CR=1 FL=1